MALFAFGFVNAKMKKNPFHHAVKETLKTLSSTPSSTELTTKEKEQLVSFQNLAIRLLGEDKFQVALLNGQSHQLQEERRLHPLPRRRRRKSTASASGHIPQIG